MMKMKAGAILLLLGILYGCTDQGTAPADDAVAIPPGAVSFSQNIKPILDRAGCTSCHGGNGGLFVGSTAQIRQGGIHGAAVIPGDAASSILAQKISATPPFGDRMPQGGPYLADSIQQVIRTWINQGAPDN